MKQYHEQDQCLKRFKNNPLILRHVVVKIQGPPMTLGFHFRKIKYE